MPVRDPVQKEGLDKNLETHIILGAGYLGCPSEICLGRIDKIRDDPIYRSFIVFEIKLIYQLFIFSLAHVNIPFMMIVFRFYI